VCKDEYFDDYDDAKNHEVLCRFHESQELRFREETFRKITDETWEVEELRETDFNRKVKKPNKTKSKPHYREASKPEKLWTCEKCHLGFSRYVEAFLHERVCTAVIAKAKRQFTDETNGLHERKSLAFEEHCIRRKSKSAQRPRKEMRDDADEPAISSIDMSRKEQRDQVMVAAHQILQEKEHQMELTATKEKNRSSRSPPKRRPHPVADYRSRSQPPLKFVQCHRRERSSRYDERSKLRATTVTKQNQKSRSPLPSDCDSTIKYLCKVCEDACFDDIDSASAHEASCTGFKGHPYIYVRE